MSIQPRDLPALIQRLRTQQRDACDTFEPRPGWAEPPCIRCREDEWRHTAREAADALEMTQARYISMFLEKLRVARQHDLMTELAVSRAEQPQSVP